MPKIRLKYNVQMGLRNGKKGEVVDWPHRVCTPLVESDCAEWVTDEPAKKQKP